MNGWRPHKLIQHFKSEQRAGLRKRLLESWIADAVAGDAALGRSDKNWAESPLLGMKAALPTLKAKGILVYAGSGQLVLADMKPEAPLVMQRRPLAQREVFLDFTGGVTP